MSDVRLGSGEVHAWSASLDVAPETAARLYETLSADEHRRSARFRFERDRQHFIAARGILRDILGRYLGIQPRQVDFVYNKSGKPDLSPGFGSALRFNLSHSNGLVLVAVANAASVGVDVELIREQSDDVDVARSFFSAAEIDHLAALPRHLRADAFFSCWTKKEAYLKACGAGLAAPLNEFSVPLTTDPGQASVDRCAESNVIVATRPWSFYTLRPAPGYAGALAIEGRGWRVRQWQWNAPQA